MASKVKGKINAHGTEITVLSIVDSDDFISLTDIARYRNSDEPNIVVSNWMRNFNTIEFLGLWESLYNNNFNPIEFDGFKNQSGNNAFTLSPTKWIKATNAIGIQVKAGRYGGTYAHKDIAFEFASWISPEFKLYVIKDYERLKTAEEQIHSKEWTVNRLLAKSNYKIHTDAVKENLISPNITPKEAGFIYADEADLLNVALFGVTAKEWKSKNPETEGNIRDNATLEQLLVMTNLENTNAYLIEQKFSQKDRLTQLRKIAVDQLEKLTGIKSVKELNVMNDQATLIEN